MMRNYTSRRTEQHHVLRSVFVCVCRTVFRASGLGVEDRQNGFRVTCCLELGQRGTLPIKSKNTCWTETTDSIYFAVLSLDFLRKRVKCLFPGCRIACEMPGPVLKHESNISVQEYKSCDNMAFHLLCTSILIACGSVCVVIDCSNHCTWRVKQSERGTSEWWAVLYDEWLEKANLKLTSVCVCRAIEINLTQITFISSLLLLNGALFDFSILCELIYVVKPCNMGSKLNWNMCSLFNVCTQNMCT
jgi:hypothetical protein